MTPPLQFGDLPSGISLELAGAGATDAIDAAIELGNRARDTLGHLPFAAYEDAARNGGLLLGREGGNVVAYALFGATDRHVRLTHLCVEQRLRRGGIARLLVNWISERHADRPGILVWCRRDYRLADMWSHLGFERLSERPGRGRGNRILVAWWRDHGHPHLFTRAGETAIVRASVDLNIIRDLADESRPDRVESLALLSDQSADRLEVVRTPALDVEMDAMDDELRTPCVRRAHTLISIQPSRGHYASVHAEMLASANAADPIFVQSTQGQLDIRYVSEAIAAGLNVFVTRDARLTSTLGPLAAAHGLRILRPAEVIVRMDELVRAEAYQPAALQATGFTRRLIGSGGELDLDAFVSRNTRERLPQLRSRVRSLTAAGLERVGIFSPEQKLVAAFVVQDDAGVLHVPLFRVADGPLADTIAHQLVFTLRMEALKRGDSLIRLVDPFMSRATLAAAADDGFLTHGDAHYAFVIDVCGSARDVEHAAVAAARAASLPSPAAIRHRLSGIAAGQVERVWWPAKVVDSELTSYLMPIRQSFSNELLGQPRGLFGRSAELGLSREHVYFRSPGGLKPKAPARLLWYMSGSARGSVEPAGVIASSHLEEVIEGPPDELYSRFRHLGVWSLSQIEVASRRGTAQALRFANTEMLRNSVPLQRVRAIVGRAPQGPVSITSDAYARLYREGQGSE